MAKKTKKKKKTGGGGGGAATGIKGFGSSSPTADSTKGTSSAGSVDRSKDALSFYSYLEKNGAGDNLKRVGLGYFPVAPGVTIRGVVALRPIKKGEIIISIPYELALNLGREGDDPTLPGLNLLQQYCQTQADNVHDEKGRSLYFSMLPPFRGTDCLGSTDFFPDKALDMLQSPLVKEETLNRREKTRSRFESDVLPVMETSKDSFRWENGEAVTEEHLRWAVWLVTSRVLTVQGEQRTGDAFRLMIPLIDMCNHDRGSKHVLSGRAVPGGQLKVVAGENVEAGEQVNICYGGGVAGNDRFIQDYGFLDAFDGGKAYDIVAQQLLGKLRMMEGGGGGGMIPSVDRERSLEALRDTTVQEDEEALRKDGGTRSGAERTAVEYRLGVKKALAQYVMIP